MRRHRGRALLTELVVGLVACTVVAGCTLPPLRTPTPRPSPSRVPTATPSPTATTPSPMPSATPGLAAAPKFGAGELIATAVDGLRVRRRPNLSSVTITGLLPLNATLQVVMGPIIVGQNGWFLVTDADGDEPQFEEGWVASGFEPEPFLASTGEVSRSSPYVASFAQTGNAEYGPIEIDDGDHAIRWVALDPERVRCEFAVLLAEGSSEPVLAIRATVGNGVDPGTLQPGGFAALGVRGQAFLTVESDCAWTLVIVRLPDASPAPAPSSAP